MVETKQELVEEFRRETMLKATRHVVARRGLAGASMQAIADEAGVAKGTLYLYFKDRDDLIEQAVGSMLDELMQLVRSELRPGRPLREALLGLVRTEFEFFDTHRDFLRVYAELRAPEGAACERRWRRPQFARFLELLEGFLADATRRGEMKRFDPGRVAFFVAEGLTSIVKRQLDERGRKGAEEAEWIVELLLDGMYRRSRA
jgi:TetR/AcrR family transcriptional repressor of multidrug resistance operon